MGENDVKSRRYVELVGEKLRRLRQDRGLSLQEVCDRSGGSFVVSTLSAYERGKRSLSLERLLELAEIYGLAPTSLLEVDDDSEIMGSLNRNRPLRLRLENLQRLTEDERRPLENYLAFLRNLRTTHPRDPHHPQRRSCLPLHPLRRAPAGLEGPAGGRRHHRIALTAKRLFIASRTARRSASISLSPASRSGASCTKRTNLLPMITPSASAATSPACSGVDTPNPTAKGTEVRPRRRDRNSGRSSPSRFLTPGDARHRHAVDEAGCGPADPLEPLVRTRGGGEKHHVHADLGRGRPHLTRLLDRQVGDDDPQYPGLPAGGEEAARAPGRAPCSGRRGRRERRPRRSFPRRRTDVAGPEALRQSACDDAWMTGPSARGPRRGCPARRCRRRAPGRSRRCADNRRDRGPPGRVRHEERTTGLGTTLQRNGTGTGLERSQRHPQCLRRRVHVLISPPR